MTLDTAIHDIKQLSTGISLADHHIQITDRHVAGSEMTVGNDSSAATAAAATAAAVAKPGHATTATTTVQQPAARFLEAPPFHIPIRPLSPDAVSLLSIDEYEQLGPRSLSPSALSRRQLMQDDDGVGSEKRSPRQSLRGRLGAFWVRNLGLLYIFVSMMFGSLMNVTTRTLEVEGNKGKGLHPFQVCILSPVRFGI